MRRHRLCIACIATTTRHEVGVEFYGSLPGLLFQWPDVCTRVGISETLGGLMICQGDGYPYSRTASMQPLFCQHPRCSGDHGKTTASCRAAFCCWVTQCSQNISTPGERRQLHSHSVRSLHSALCTLHSVEAVHVVCCAWKEYSQGVPNQRLRMSLCSTSFVKPVLSALETPPDSPSIAPTDS